MISSGVLGMFALVVRFDLTPGAGPAFDALVDETLGLIRAREPRTVIYACHQVEGAPDSRIFYELYEDRAAFDEHEAGEHVKRFLAEREQHLAGPPRVEFLDLPGRFQPAVVGAGEGSHG
jgi:quinol monooxygenase YgiN